MHYHMAAGVANIKCSVSWQPCREMHFFSGRLSTAKYILRRSKMDLSKNISSSGNMAQPVEIPVDSVEYISRIKSSVVPRLTDDLHKGQCGRIGVIGGSLEYTGAPYFAAISALKVGADLAHVFCQRDAAVVIKSYSPELIVHPLLDADDAVQLIEPWLERLHVIIIGPGLGRQPKIQKSTIRLIELCRAMSKPLIIDADGLALLNDNLKILSRYENAILTPNAIEFQRLFEDEQACMQLCSQLGEGVTILRKGATDKLFIPAKSQIYALPAGGSGRRCGGQGDLLCGSIATFYHWCLQSKQENAGLLAAFAATYLVKNCNAAAFNKLGRGMLASDMINEISAEFSKTFEM